MADRDDIIDTIIAEAYGEGSEGMRRVAETILNRSDIRGITPGEVVRQPDQYTGYWSPGASAQEAQRQQEARDAAWAAYELAQGPDDPTRGADHYFNPNIVQPSWARNMEPTGQYGGHAFYNSNSGRAVGTRQATANPATAPVPQTIGPGAIAQRNQVTPQIPAWAATGMNQGSGQITAQNDPLGSSAVRAALVQSGPLSPDQVRTAREIALRGNQSYAGQSGTGPHTLSGNPAQDAAHISGVAVGGARSPSAFGAFPQGGMDRLQPSTGMAFAGYPVTQSAALLASRNAAPTMMASVAPKVAPVPFQRPSFGMGGPGMLPVNAAMTAIAQAAPVTPRLTMMNAYAPGAQQAAPAPVAQKPPVGAVLGQAANGGFMIQGHNGVMNSTTQNSAYWKNATGQDSNGSERRREASSRSSGDASRGNHDWNS